MPTTTKSDPKDIWSSEAKQADIERITQAMADIAAQRISIEEAFEYREDGGIRIALPQEPEKMELEAARDAINEEIENRDATYEFSKFFYCRPQDGAWAFNKVLKEIWKAPVGKEVRGFFGGQPPQKISVKVSPNEEFNVPWGQLFFAPWKTTFVLGIGQDRNYGIGLEITAYGQKKFEGAITGFFMTLEKYIAENSIYAGRALKAVTTERPEFINPYVVDPKIFAYSDDNYWDLKTQVWGLIEHADLIKQSNAGWYRDEEHDKLWYVDRDDRRWLFNSEDPDERTRITPQMQSKVERTHIKLSNNVLLSGDNGGGKTAACLITGQYCMKYGRTFVQCDWNEPLSYALRFVQAINRPAVMVLEDVEHLFQNPTQMYALLDEFDGMRSKGFEVTLLMTTNHPEDIPKAMKGGHRIDHTINIGPLDTHGTQRLIDAHIPASQRPDLDYDRLGTAYEGFMPAFIVRSLEDVLKHSIIRTGKIGEPKATEDFERAARGLRPEQEQHALATDRKTVPDLTVALGEALRPMFESVLRHHVVDLSDGEIMVRE